jgi:hypothetical protein
MAHEWIVDVVAGGKPVTDAKVAVVQNSALSGLEWPFASVKTTHKHATGGRYREETPLVPEAGDWTLIVTAKGKAPVVQPFKVKLSGKSKVQEATSVPSPRTARAVSFQAEGKKKTDKGARFASFTATLFPFVELVFVSGTEYHDKGTQFRIFAENYGIALLRESKVTAGVIMTLFSADDRARLVLVPASGEKWLQVGIKRFGSTEGTKPGKRRTPTAATDFSITDVYKYVSRVGASAPGRVLEVGFFTHSFPVGPIIYNTNDELRDPVKRDPDDFDGRIKDFNSTNTAQWPNLKKALASGGRWRVWGCSATTTHHDLAKAAHLQRRLGDDTHFTVSSRIKKDDGTLIKTLDDRTTRKRVRREMDDEFHSQSYLAAAATHLDLPVLGAPPGIGSNFGSPSKPKAKQRALSLMFISVGDNSDNYAFFSAEFAPEFAPTDGPYDKGYVDYNRLRKRVVAPVPAFSAESHVLRKQFLVVEPNNPFSVLEWRNGIGRKIGTTDVRLVTTKSRTGFAEPGKDGVIYVLNDRLLPDNSVGSFMQQDGRLFDVTRDARGAFTVLGRRLR